MSDKTVLKTGRGRFVAMIRMEGIMILVHSRDWVPECAPAAGGVVRFQWAGESRLPPVLQ